MTVGTKVVCIDDKFPAAAARHYTALPVKNKTYVIRGIRPGVGYTLQPEIAVTLIGLINPVSSTPPFPERGFNIERFRPLDEIQQENAVKQSVTV